mmetsp:Transcript_7253/g.30914  ORF Transcript_7253/g.30914 Transcript_7253/m.30914 type:complete len:323 (-) Transcript_7253:1163-2131(-)
MSSSSASRCTSRSNPPPLSYHSWNSFTSAARVSAAAVVRSGREAFRRFTSSNVDRYRAFVFLRATIDSYVSASTTSAGSPAPRSAADLALASSTATPSASISALRVFTVSTASFKLALASFKRALAAAASAARSGDTDFLYSANATSRCSASTRLAAAFRAVSAARVMATSFFARWGLSGGGAASAGATPAANPEASASSSPTAASSPVASSPSAGASPSASPSPSAPSAFSFSSAFSPFSSAAASPAPAFNASFIVSSRASATRLSVSLTASRYAFLNRRNASRTCRRLSAGTSSAFASSVSRNIRTSDSSSLLSTSPMGP